MTDTHPDLIDFNSGDEYVWTDKGYANTEDTDETAWSRADLERDGASLAAVDTLSAGKAARLRDGGLRLLPRRTRVLRPRLQLPLHRLLLLRRRRQHDRLPDLRKPRLHQRIPRRAWPDDAA